MSKISDRIKYARIEKGYCLLCGTYGPLSKDHVPPKSISELSGIEQKLLFEYEKGSEIKGLVSHHGSVFKTICKECNAGLSIYDSEIKNVVEVLRNKIRNYLANPISPYSTVSATVNTIDFLRGCVGHMISAAPNIRCMNPSGELPFLDPLKNFVIGKNNNIFETHKFLYWFYPHRLNISGSMFTLGEIGNIERSQSAGVCLYFYPLAILIIEKHATYSEIGNFAQEINPSDTKIIINIASENYHSSGFPFFNLKNTMVILHEAFVTISYKAPAKK